MDDFELKFTPRFKKDFKKIANDPQKLREARDVFQLLIDGGVKNILQSMKPHKLKGGWKNHWECHIRPDFLMIWLQYDAPSKTIYLERIGSHADIFKK